MASVSKPWVEHILQTAEQFSLSREQLLNTCPLQPIRIGELERYDLDEVVQLWHHVIEQSGDQDFGLRMGTTMTPSHLNIVSHIVLNSPTLLDGLNKAQRYYRLISDGGEVSIKTQEAETLLVYTPKPEQHAFHEQQLHAAIATLHTVLKWALGQQYQPLKISLCQAQPVNADSLFASYFDCPLLFSQENNAIHIDEQLFNLQQFNDQGLGALHEEFAERLLKTLSQSSWRQRVKPLIESCLSQGDINRDWVATQLNVSARTLQRRLGEEDCQFQDIVDELRQERAIDYLSQQTLSQEDISSLLGYAEPSAFYRAFKRWTGQTPKEYQQSILLK